MVDTKNICSKCGGDKNVNGFAKTGLQCLICLRTRQRESCKRYKRNNREHVSEYNKKYKQENPQNEYNAEYFQKNKKELQEKRRPYFADRRKNDPQYKLRMTLKNRIQKAVKIAGTGKSNKTKELLGCSVPFMKDWLSHQFRDGMTLENHGSVWHIDHVKPCASFNLLDENEQRECFNWSNLQPLLCDENLSKNDKIIPELIESHKKKAEKFLASYNSQKVS
jgi:hypothetical protein